MKEGVCRKSSPEKFVGGSAGFWLMGELSWAALREAGKDGRKVGRRLNGGSTGKVVRELAWK